MHNNKPLHILFVEDSEDDEALLLNALAGEFATLSHERVDSAAALRGVLARQGWDVIICDHSMPALDAPTALRIAQESGSDAPFIVVSGSIPEDVAVATMMAGAADTISKDKLSRLVPAVKRELKKVSEMSDLRRAQAASLPLHLARSADRPAQSGIPEQEVEGHDRRFRHVWKAGAHGRQHQPLLADFAYAGHRSR